MLIASLIAAESALRAAGVKIKHSDRQIGAMFGRTSWSLNAFGETVTVQVQPSGTSRCHVAVHSEMRPVFDIGGRNKKNIAAFQHALDQELEEPLILLGEGLALATKLTLTELFEPEGQVLDLLVLLLELGKEFLEHRAKDSGIVREGGGIEVRGRLTHPPVKPRMSFSSF